MECCAAIAYDGSRFRGWQSQPHGLAVQDQLNRTLSTVYGQEVRVDGISRTDRNVHAYDQRIHWKVDSKIPAEKIPRMVNRRLEGIRFLWAREVPAGFSLSRLEVAKEYQYKIMFREELPFYQPYFWCKEPSLQGDSQEFLRILRLYEGFHDYFYLCRHDRTREILDYRRRIFQVDLDCKADCWVISIVGENFLWMMVRFMVSFSWECFCGSLPEENLVLFLEGKEVWKNAKPNFMPAPGSGLYLRRLIPIEDLR